MSDLTDLFSELVRAETELWNHVDRRLREEVGMPANRFEPLRVIGALGACRVGDVAAALAIGVSGTSKLVDRLEADGFCARQADPEDRRSAFVSLTAAGTEILARAERVFEAGLESRLGSVLDPGERELLTATLRRLRDVPA